MIIVANRYEIEEMSKEERNKIFGKNHEVLSVMRSYSDPHPDVIHVPELSPSIELFNEYRKKYEEGTWTKKEFENWYTPLFIKEMTNENAKKALKNLVNTSKEHNVIIFCACEDESICHRSILGGILSRQGAKVLIYHTNEGLILMKKTWNEYGDKYLRLIS